MATRDSEPESRPRRKGESQGRNAKESNGDEPVPGGGLGAGAHGEFRV